MTTHREQAALGEQRIGALLAGAGFLARAERQRMLAGNAREFFGI